MVLARLVMVAMTNRRSPRKYAISLRIRILRELLWLFFLLISAFVTAQVTDTQVHVAPRQQPFVRTDNKPDSSLTSPSKPLKVDVDLVLVPVTVSDPMNRLVTGLAKEHFRVYDNNEPQLVLHFSSEDAPVSLGVIFDMSGSMVSKIERAREAVVEFLNTANPEDEFFVITFADKPQEMSDFTSSVEDIAGRLIHTVPKGRTALLDAVYLGISKMRGAKYAKKALLIVSDGGDNSSRYTDREIKSVVEEADTMIYAIGVYDHYFATEEERLGPILLDEITSLTGGRAFTVDNPNALSDIALKIGLELRNQYVLGYRPTQALRNGKWHKIKVRLSPPKGLPHLQLNAKKGYYAPAE